MPRQMTVPPPWPNEWSVSEWSPGIPKMRPSWGPGEQTSMYVIRMPLNREMNSNWFCSEYARPDLLRDEKKRFFNRLFTTGGFPVMPDLFHLNNHACIQFRHCLNNMMQLRPSRPRLYRIYSWGKSWNLAVANSLSTQQVPHNNLLPAIVVRWLLTFQVVCILKSFQTYADCWCFQHSVFPSDNPGLTPSL